MTEALSSRILLEDQIGPILKFDQHQIKIYEKDQSPSRVSNFSEQNIKVNNDALKSSTHDNADKKKTLNFNLARRKSRLPISKRRSDVSKKVEGFAILKTMQQNQLIKKFARTLLMKSYILSANQRSIIEQESYLQAKSDKSKQQSQNQSTTSSIFAPGSQLVMVWDISATFIHLFSLWLCPFVAAFVRDDSFATAELCIILHILIDIFIHLNRPIMVQGEIVSDKIEIIEHYFHGQLLEDLASLTMWFLMYFNFNEVYITNEIIAFLLTTISILKVKRNYENFIESLYLQGAVNQLIDLITLIVMIYIFGHIMACVFYHVGDITSQSGDSWLIHYNLLHKSVAIKYNHSIYWATMTMVTVGYGDITPQNEMELLTVNLLMLLSSCMFGYSMSSIGMILKNIQDAKLKCKRSLILMNSYMRQSSVDAQIQSRVRDFIKYQVEMESKENSEDINQIMSDLPNQLKQELETDIQMKIMQNIKIITSQFTKVTQKEVSSKLVQLKFTPGDFVYHQNQIDENLYYLKSGQISIIEEKSGRVLQTIKSCNTFGEYSFFTGLSAKASAVSAGFSEVYQIQREIFLQIISSNSKDFERFHNIKDNLILNQNYYVILQNCNFCKQYTHCNIDCPLLTYQPDIQTKMLRDQHRQSFQQRTSFVRMGDKIKSLLVQQQMQTAVNDFLETKSVFHEIIREIQKHSEETPNQQQNLTAIKVNHTEDPPIEQVGSYHNSNSPAQQTSNLNPLPPEQSNNQVPPSLAQLRGKSSRYVFNPAQKQNHPKNYFVMDPQKQQNQLIELMKENVSFIYQLYFIYQFHNTEIDQMREYMLYMPQNNCSNTIKQRERIIEKKQQQRQQNFQDTQLFQKTVTPMKYKEMGSTQFIKINY